MKRFVIMAGGTGGHVIPALAVAKELIQQGMQVSWIGTQHGIEKKLVEDANIEIDYIDIVGFRRTGLLRQISMPLRLVKALWQSMAILRQRKPDAVIGFGGYASGPGGLAALIMRIPIVLHEQNSIAGATNKYLAKVAHKVLSGFADVEGIKQSIWVGNPVRQEIAKIGQEQSLQNTGSVHILVVGGSQGAVAFNTYLPETLSQLEATEFKIWHQSGSKHYQNVLAAYVGAANVKVTPFIDDMAQAYAWADVVICRAGAMTVAEICAAAKVAIFIPYKYAVSNHQLKNAQLLVEQQAAMLVSEDELKTANWLTMLEKLMKNEHARKEMQKAAFSLAKPNATFDVVSHCLEVTNA